MNGKAIVQAARSYESLKKYVESGELARTLGTIGDVASDAATEALTSARFASRPTEETGRAITHLQLAHKAFERKWKGDGYSSYAEQMEAAAKDREMLVLMALAYQYVGDRALALRTLELVESFEARFLKGYYSNAARHPVHSAKRSGSFYLSPFRSTKAAVKAIKPPLSDRQIEELRAEMERMELPRGSAAHAG